MPFLPNKEGADYIREQVLKKSDIDFKNNIIHIQRTLTKDENDRVIIGKTTKTYAGTRDIPITNLISDVLINRSLKTNNLLWHFNT